MANPFLRWLRVVFVRMVFFMTGAIALVREIYALYSDKPATASAFWTFVWIAFVFSGFFAWWQERASALGERKERERAEAALNDQAPRLYLEYSKMYADEFWKYSGLLVRNGGRRDAFTVRLSCDSSAKIRLEFDEMPIQRIGPDKAEPVQVRTQHLSGDGRWFPIGGTPGAQVEGCLERLKNAGREENIPVTIKYADYEGKEYMTPWVIRRAAEMFLPKRIWCEPDRLSGQN